MALTRLNNAIFTGNENSESSTAFSVANNDLTAGNLAILVIAMDNLGTADADTSQVTGIIDSKGNQWNKAGERTETNGGAAKDGSTVAVWYSVITTTLITGTDTITVSYSGALVAKAIDVDQYTKGAGTTISIAGTVQSESIDNADAAALSISGLDSKEYLFFRAESAETDTAGIATPTTNYTSQTGQGTLLSGSGGSEKGHVGGEIEWRILTGTGDSSNYTANDTTADRAGLFMAFQEVASTPVTNKFMPFFYP